MVIKRGDVFYADLDPIIGSEQGGCVTAQDKSLFILLELFFMARPENMLRSLCIIMHELNRKIVPCGHALPTHIHICGSKILSKNSIVLAEQIRTIDRDRLLRYVGSVGLEVMEKVDRAVKISIGVNVDE